MTRLAPLFLTAIVIPSAVGCYIPGGGWTLRTGLDFRTHCKPGAYVEVVDTRWDEWNRVAQMNAMIGTSSAPLLTPVAAPPVAQPPAQGVPLPRGGEFETLSPLPPPAPQGSPPASELNEPFSVPGVPPDTRPSAGPSARLSFPFAAPASTENSTAESLFPADSGQVETSSHAESSDRASSPNDGVKLSSFARLRRRLHGQKELPSSSEPPEADEPTVEPSPSVSKRLWIFNR
jgi:hypothetical protein